MLERLTGVVDSGLGELGVPAADREGASPRLARLALRVSEWGQRMNLSGHRDPEAIVRRLVLDAAALLETLPAFSSLVDLGSGAGFPGLPIAILRPAARIVLVEPRERRHHFQRAMVRELDLGHVEPRRCRIEDLGAGPGAPAEGFDIAVAQAVGPPDQILAEMRDWAGPGGTLVIPSSRGAVCPAVPEGFVPAWSVPYRVPLGGPERCAWMTTSA